MWLKAHQEAVLMYEVFGDCDDEMSSFIFDDEKSNMEYTMRPMDDNDDDDDFLDSADVLHRYNDKSSNILFNTLNYL